MATGDHPTMPFNIAPPAGNQVPGYERLRHVRAYIQQCSKGCGLTAHEIASRCGYGAEKLRRRRPIWDRAECSVPLAYLEAVEVDMKVLETALEADQKESDAALRNRPVPGSFLVKLLPVVYRTVALPDDVSSEYEAIEYIRPQAVAQTHFKYYLHWPGLATLFFHTDGTVALGDFRPALRIERGSVSFGYDGTGFGYVPLR